MALLLQLAASTGSLWPEPTHYVPNLKWLFPRAPQHILRNRRRLPNEFDWPCLPGRHRLTTPPLLLQTPTPPLRPAHPQLPGDDEQIVWAEIRYWLSLQAKWVNLLNAWNDLTFRMHRVRKFLLIRGAALSPISLLSLLFALPIDDALRSSEVRLTKQDGTAEKLATFSTGPPTCTLPYAIRARSGDALWKVMAESAVCLQSPMNMDEPNARTLVTDKVTPLPSVSELNPAPRMLTLPTGCPFYIAILLTRRTCCATFRVDNMDG